MLRSDNLFFQEKTSITQPYDKASPLQFYKGSLYLPMYQYVFLFHSLVTDLWCSLSVDESLMAFMEQSLTASSLQGLLYHNEKRAKGVPVFIARGTPESFIEAFSKRYSKHFKKNFQKQSCRKTTKCCMTKMTIFSKKAMSTNWAMYYQHIKNKSCISEPQFSLRKWNTLN